MKDQLNKLWIISLLLLSQYAKAQEVMLFGAGYLYNNIKEHANTIKASGFNSLTLWSLHIHPDGDLIFNDTPIISNGEYVGHRWWPKEVNKLKGKKSSIKRLGFSVGAWSVPDFEHIQKLIEEQGTGPESILYRNFTKLKEKLDLDAIDFDDESNYHVASTLEFSKMLIEMGYKITLCPYTRKEFWKSVYEKVEEFHPGAIDRIYLQCYAGGARNDPKNWNKLFGNLNVIPGLWCKNGENCTLGDTPEVISEKLKAWNAESEIGGGFVWFFGDLVKCGIGKTDDYAKAIQFAFK